MKEYVISVFALFLFYSCTTSKQIGRSAKAKLLSDSSLLTAHIGISIFDPASNKYLYNYQGDKYFVPASNTKIPTCYTAMKYLGDSLVGLTVFETDHNVFLLGTGDPTFLHADFKTQPVFNYFKSLDKSAKALWFSSHTWQAKHWGSGWAWTDYDAEYMAERSAFPIYGNVVSITGQAGKVRSSPNYFQKRLSSHSTPNNYLSRVERSLSSNDFRTFAYGNSPRIINVPFITSDTLTLSLLIDTLNILKQIIGQGGTQPVLVNESVTIHKIYSHPTDSLLKPMMHRSDNFFAEQSLLMVSNEFLGVMNDARIIDTILKTDFKDLPQKPRWADGSGLSRYNLFTPQDFVVILNKMKNEFGMDRIKEIFPTGGEGTLSSYYKSDSTFIYAKTGTLSGVVALSGFLYTKQNKLLIFSVLVNNHQGSATAVRRAVERFIQGIRQKY
jgi:serine-type D-Ala-D-Ala carboxypeptidase/endopeptidase (penicillin-binding protein 4)